MKIGQVGEKTYRLVSALLLSSSVMSAMCPTIVYAQTPQDAAATTAKYQADAKGQSEIVVTAQNVRSVRWTCLRP